MKIKKDFSYFKNLSEKEKFAEVKNLSNLIRKGDELEILYAIQLWNMYDDQSGYYIDECNETLTFIRSEFDCGVFYFIFKRDNEEVFIPIVDIINVAGFWIK